MRTQGSGALRCRASAAAGGAWARTLCRPNPGGFGGVWLTFSGARPGSRSSVLRPLFRAVIVWGSLAPNNSFQPNPFRGFGTFWVSATTLFSN